MASPSLCCAFGYYNMGKEETHAMLETGVYAHADGKGGCFKGNRALGSNEALLFDDLADNCRQLSRHEAQFEELSTDTRDVHQVADEAILDIHLPFGAVEQHLDLLELVLQAFTFNREITQRRGDAAAS